jgi:phosphoribosylformylglycinamidine synthase
VTDGNYVCEFNGETVVDVDAHFLGEGAPMNDLPAEEPTAPERDLPDVDVAEAVEAIVGHPNTASKRWVYRQYDHEVQVRTARRPGDDAAILAIREARAADGSSGEHHETGIGLAYSAGADPNWTDANPYEGARAVALENATNVAAKGATPLAAVDCLNGGNPEKPDVYGGFKGIVDGLADMCETLSTPVVGGNVSLYNDSPSGPIPPTPTLALVGTKEGYDAPPLDLAGEGDLLVVGDLPLAGEADARLGGSQFLATHGGSDAFPELPADPAGLVEALAAVANLDSTLASHDVSHGGLAVSLAEMVHDGAGTSVSLDSDALLFHEQAGRAVVETTDPDAVREAFEGIAPVTKVGSADDSGTLSLTVDGTGVELEVTDIQELRSILDRELE